MRNSSDSAKAAIAQNVSRETFSRLETIANLLTKWQKTINLVSPATIPELWTRHIADSLQLMT
ncbi:MAG: 16S rRNA (guanine(527)-N(7))-methyltransferase RsmG, partial [Rhizobiales bacterium 35-66-30]